MGRLARCEEFVVSGIRCPCRLGCLRFVSNGPAEKTSRILRIDTVESVGAPGWTQQFLSFLICGFGHSDSRGIDTAALSKEGVKNIPAVSLALWAGFIPYSPYPPTITLRSRLVHQVNPAKSIK